MFSIDVKEKFSEIHIHEDNLSELLMQNLQTYIKNQCQNFNRDVCINLEHIKVMSLEGLKDLIVLQEQFKSAQKSCYFYGLKNSLKENFENQDLWTEFQHVNTDSEAWDMVQFEILERELLL